MAAGLYATCKCIILDRIKWNGKPPSIRNQAEPKRTIFPSFILGVGGVSLPSIFGSKIADNILICHDDIFKDQSDINRPFIHQFMDDAYSVLLNKTCSKYIQILYHDIAILYSFISIKQLKVNFFQTIPSLCHGLT